MNIYYIKGLIMIFEDIIYGTAAINAETVLTVLFILAMAVAAAVIIAALKKAFLKDLGFSKLIFSPQSLLTVVCFILFGVSPIKAEKMSAAKVFLTWLCFAATGEILCFLPLSWASAYTAGVLFIGTALINLLPFPGFLCFYFIKSLLPEKAATAFGKLEKYSAVFVVFGLLIFARTGAVYAVIA